MLVRNKRWTVSPRRFVISVVLGVCGTFVVFGGLGMWSFNIGAIGFAIIAGGAGLYAVSAVTSRHTYVAGEARVVYASLPPPGAHIGRCNLRLIVRAPNISPISIRMRDPAVPVDKWPVANVNLPVQIAVGDPRRIKIIWDEVDPKNWVRRRQTGSAPNDATDLFDPTASGYGDAGAVTETIEVDEDSDAGADDPTYVADADPMDVEPVDVEPVDVIPIDVEPVNVEPVDAEAVTDDEDELDDVDVTEVEGRRSIEIDLPGVRLSPSPVPPRKPSPRPRTSPENPLVPDPVAVAADGPSSMASVAPAVPLRFTEASLFEADTADEDVPLYDQDAMDGSAAATRPLGWVRAAAVTLFVRDLDTSIVFYRDVLGFREVDAGRQRAMLTTGDARVVLKEAQAPPVDRRTVQVLLTVPDIDEAYRHLRTARADLVHRPRRVSKDGEPTTWAAQFRDPDGHAIVLIEEPSLA